MSTSHRLPLLLSAMLLVGCVGELGNGQIITEHRSVAPFRRLSVESGIHATAALGVPALSLTTDSNLLPYIESWVDAETLHLGIRDGIWPTSSYGFRAAVTSDAMIEVTASGGSHVDAVGTPASQWPITASGGSEVSVARLTALNLRIDASGGSDVTVSGSSTGFDANASGGSKIHGDGCTVNDVTLSGSGGSELQLFATDSARGSLSGGSQAWIYGAPPLRVISLSGGSHVYWMGE